MSTTPMPTAPSGPDFDTFAFDKIGEALRGDSGTSQTAAATTEPETITEPEIEPSVDGTQTEAKTSVEGADATAQAQTETEPNPYDDVEEPTKDAEQEKGWFATPRGREVYGGYKVYRDISKPTTEGGIGFAPTVDALREHFTSHRNMIAMRSDFLSGEPGRVEQFIGHWFGPNRKTGQMSPQAMAALGQLEPTLNKLGVAEAYGQAAAPFLESLRDRLIDERNGEQDKSMRDALYKAAQVIHHKLYGEWLPETKFQGGAAPVKNGNTGRQVVSNGNGLDAERAALDAEWQRLNDTRTQAQRESDQRWYGTLRGEQQTALGSEIDKALAPLKTQNEKSPRIWNSLKADFANEIAMAIQSDPAIWQIYLARVEDAKRSGNPAAVEEAVKHYKDLAVPIIKAKRRAFLEGAGVTIKQQSQDRHAQLRQIASHTAPGSNGAPVRKSIAPALERKPGENFEEYSLRRVAAALQSR